MRIRLTFNPDQESSQIPINYNSYVSQFVYDLLQPDQAFSYQESGTIRTGIPYYTFSNLYIPGVEQRERVLEFGKVPVELTLSILVEQKGESEVLERIRSLQKFEFDVPEKAVHFSLNQVEVIDEVKKFPRRVRFRMLSPLASPLWTKGEVNTQDYIHYADPEFSESIKAILLAKYERWKGKRLDDKRLTFRLDHRYVQRRRGRISKLVTFYEGGPDERRIKALVAPFEVEGNPELIWLGYVAGFGEKNLLGFGCAEAVTVAPRTLPMNEPEEQAQLKSRAPFRRPAAVADAY